MKSERLESLRLDKQPAIFAVIDLVIAGGFLDEGDLIGIFVVEDDGRCSGVDLQIPVQAGRQLGKIGGGVEIELPSEEAVGHGAHHREEHGERHRGEENQSRSERQRHGGLAVSM